MVNSFDNIVSGKESWFVYVYSSDCIFASCKDEMVPREQWTIATETVMQIISFCVAMINCTEMSIATSIIDSRIFSQLDSF
jgi:hypothetical protein